MRRQKCQCFDHADHFQSKAPRIRPRPASRLGFLFGEQVPAFCFELFGYKLGATERSNWVKKVCFPFKVIWSKNTGEPQSNQIWDKQRKVVRQEHRDKIAPNLILISRQSHPRSYSVPKPKIILEEKPRREKESNPYNLDRSGFYEKRKKTKKEFPSYAQNLEKKESIEETKKTGEAQRKEKTDDISYDFKFEIEEIPSGSKQEGGTIETPKARKKFKSPKLIRTLSQIELKKSESGRKAAEKNKKNIKGNILQVYNDFQTGGSQLGGNTNASAKASEPGTGTDNSLILVKSEATKHADLRKSESTLKSRPKS